MKAPRTYALAAFALICGAAALTGSPAQPAASPPASRVAVCDIVEVFNNYQRAKDLGDQLDERRQAIRAEGKKREDAVKKLGLELENYKKGTRQYEQTVNEITRLSINAKAYLEYEDARALREHMLLTKEMYGEIKAVIAQVAKQRGVAIVLQREPETLETENTTQLLREIYSRKVHYYAETLDLTEQVLMALNQAYKARKPAAGTP